MYFTTEIPAFETNAIHIDCVCVQQIVPYVRFKMMMTANTDLDKLK